MAANESAEVVVDRIENYLLVLQDDLTNVTALNQDLRIENRKKDTLIESKTAYLKSLRDVAVADVHQLEVGSAAAEEDLAFQCNVVVEAIEVLKMKRLREAQMEEENKRLKASIKRMETAMLSDRAQHAHDMHVLNKRMQEIRKQMEKTLKVQLTEMDRGYKQRAFASLTERQKQDLLQNAQMKEEKALQDAGMLIMQVRMRQQEDGMAAMKSELGMLHRQEETIRTRLGELFEEKYHLTNELNAFRDKENALLDAKDAILDEIEAPPTMEVLQEDIEDCEAAIERERKLALMWYARLCKLRQLETELRPVSLAEKAGYYSVANFPLTPIQLDRASGKHVSIAMPAGAHAAKTGPSSRPTTGGLSAFAEEVDDDDDDDDDDGALQASRARATLTTAASSLSRPKEGSGEYTVKLSHLAEAQRRDRALFAALKPLHGREGVLLSNPKPIPASVLPPEDVPPPSDKDDPPTLALAVAAAMVPLRAATVPASLPQRDNTDDFIEGIGTVPPPAALSPQKSMRMTLSKRGSLVSLLKQMQKDTNRGPAQVAQNMVAYTALEIVKIWQQTRHARYGAAAYEDDEYDEADGEEEYVDDGDDDWADGPLGTDPGASWKPFGHDSLRGGEKTNQKVGPTEEAPPAPTAHIRTIFDEDPNEGTDVKAATIDLDPIRRFVQELVADAPYSGLDPDGAEDLDVLKHAGRKFSFLRPSLDEWTKLEQEMEAKGESEAVDGGAEDGEGGPGEGEVEAKAGENIDAKEGTKDEAPDGDGGSDAAPTRASASASAVSQGNSSHLSSPSLTPRMVTGASAAGGPGPSSLFAEQPLPPGTHGTLHLPQDEQHFSAHPHKHLRIDLDAELLSGASRRSSMNATHEYESPMGRRSTTFLARFEQDSVPVEATRKALDKFSLIPPLKVNKKIVAHPLVASAQAPPSLAAMAAAHRRQSTILPWRGPASAPGVLEALGGSGVEGEGSGFGGKRGFGTKGGPASDDPVLGGFRAFGGRKGGNDVSQTAPRPSDRAGTDPPLLGLPATGLSLDAELDVLDILQRSASSGAAAGTAAPLGMARSRTQKALVPAAPPVDPLASESAARKLVMAHTLQSTPGGSLYQRNEGSGRPPTNKARAASSSSRHGAPPSGGTHPGGDASWWQPREKRPKFTSEEKMKAVRKEIVRSKYERDDLHEYAKRSFETL